MFVSNGLPKAVLRVASQLASTAFLLLAGATWAVGADPVTIVTLGDSYINGFTILKHEDQFTAKVAAALSADGREATFQTVGFKDTSLDALQWLQSPTGQVLLANPDRHVLILEVAQNDCLRFTLEQSRDNLDQILSALASRNIPVLVVGTLPYEHCMSQRGESYRRDFLAMFADLAIKYGDLLYPNFKAGIEGQEEFLARDHDHPNKDGEAIIAANILLSVEALIDRAR